MNTEKINRKLRSMVSEKGILIAAHRGTKGANIIENTVDAFDCARLNDADIIELDVISSTDGVLYVFHDGNENRLLGVTTPIKEMSSAEIDKLCYRNAYGKKTSYHVNRFEDVLRHLKGDTLINVDRCWDIFDSVIAAVEKYEMFDQVIFKCELSKQNLTPIAKSGKPLMFMSMATSPEDIELSLKLGLNLVAIEVNFTSEDAPVLAPELFSRIHEQGILLWANSLSLKSGWTASAWHDDNRAITGDMYGGWGWFVEHGFDIIQTDWPMMLRRYLTELRQSPVKINRV